MVMNYRLYFEKIKGGLQQDGYKLFVRLIVEREREIQNFKAVATYSVVAEFTNEAGKSFKAKLPKKFQYQKKAEDF
jgi:DNA topoisomerase-1